MPTPETIHLWGGALCLDFANSVDWREDETPLTPATDALAEPATLARWGRRVGLFRRGAEPAAGELAAARELRAALHAVFAAIARGEDPPAPALARLAADLAEAAGAGRLERRDGAWRLTWPAGDPRHVRLAVAADAAALLADPERLARVRRCPGHDCGWLFLDASGRRRWCSMQTCGSRAKMRRLYERRRAAEAERPPA
jgi:predicted RNA-binding Zn ribbon-like protein